MKTKKFLAKLLAIVVILSFCAFALPLLAAAPIFWIFGSISEGFKAHGKIVDWEMHDSLTITKGYGVEIDSNDYVILAQADGAECVGVAIETKTAAAGEHPPISFCVHGFVDVIILSTGTDVVPGDPLMISTTAGKFCLYTDTGVEIGGLQSHRKVARCYETKDVSVDDACLAFFCA